MSPMKDALIFLVSTVFDLYIFLLVIRVLLAYAGANYYDPMTQFVVRCTDIIVKPLRRLIPNVRGIEMSAILIIIALELIKYLLLIAISNGNMVLYGLLIVALADTLKLFLQTMFYAIILQAILSWVQPGSPMAPLLYKITSPVIRPIQRLVPAVGGMDISPIPAMILLQLMIIIIVQPLMLVGLGAMGG